MRVRELLLATVTAVLSGCATLGYYGQAVRGQAEILCARRPLAAVIADPASLPELRRKLLLARDARSFAVQELGLPDNASYQYYTDLHRPFVVWNVFAAPALSLDPVESCFPLVGCLAYRGYFREAAAHAHASELASTGHDVYVGGVAAYSTLGWFADPLLNTMLAWSDRRLVKTLFHELAHQHIYLPDDTAFNESFAMAVADLGYAQWRAARGEASEPDEEERRDEALVELLIRHRDALQALYARPDLDDATKLRRKQEQFAALAADYAAVRESWQGDTSYDRWMSEDMNNAKLASIATYHELVPGFLTLFERSHRSFPEFYRRVEALKGETREARASLLEAQAHEARAGSS